MTDTRYINKSEPTKGICERARRVAFHGESPTEEWMGEIEVMSASDGSMCLMIERSHKAKYGGKKWHRTSSYVTISAEAWEHLISASTQIQQAAA